jgi:hypothetical protein
VAVNSLDDGEADDPEFLATLQPRATSVSLSDGERKQLELPLVER